MKCTACGGMLQEINAGGVLVDVCEGGCGGIWCDNREIKKLDQKHESAGESLLDIPRDSSIRVDHTEQRMCPKCPDQPMMRHFMSVKHEVEADECPACGGYWLDFGELGSIRDQFETEAERNKAFDAYFDDLFGAKMREIEKRDEARLAKFRAFAHFFRFICPTYYIPGKQAWGAF